MLKNVIIEELSLIHISSSANIIHLLLHMFIGCNLIPELTSVFYCLIISPQYALIDVVERPQPFLTSV